MFDRSRVNNLGVFPKVIKGDFFVWIHFIATDQWRWNNSTVSKAIWLTDQALAVYEYSVSEKEKQRKRENFPFKTLDGSRYDRKDGELFGQFATFHESFKADRRQ